MTPRAHRLVLDVREDRNDPEHFSLACGPFSGSVGRTAGVAT